MSVHRGWIFTCDGCGEEEISVPIEDCPRTDDAARAIRDRGWKSVRAGDGWEHIGPDCAAGRAPRKGSLL